MFLKTQFLDPYMKIKIPTWLVIQKRVGKRFTRLETRAKLFKEGLRADCLISKLNAYKAILFAYSLRFWLWIKGTGTRIKNLSLGSFVAIIGWLAVEKRSQANSVQNIIRLL